VARIARASGCSIHLLEVVTPPIDYGGGLAMVSLMIEQLIESETTAATDYLQTMAASPKLAGIQTTTEVVFGIPAQYGVLCAKLT
jgi:nucleotide-binding universal stress UspA family protein